MDTLPRPRFVAGIGLFLYLAVLIGAMRLSWIGLLEVRSAFTLPHLLNIPGTNALMSVRAIVHSLVLATGAVSVVGTILRRPWGRTAALAFLPARLGAVAILFLAGLALGLNPLLPLERAVLTTSLVNIPMIMPLFWFSKELKAWYRHGIVPPAGSDTTGFDPSNPYLRGSNSSST